MQFKLKCKPTGADAWTLYQSHGRVQTQRCGTWDVTGKKPKENIRVEVGEAQCRLGEAIAALHALAEHMGGFSKLDLGVFIWVSAFASCRATQHCPGKPLRL